MHAYLESCLLILLIAAAGVLITLTAWVPVPCGKNIQSSDCSHYEATPTFVKHILMPVNWWVTTPTDTSIYVRTYVPIIIAICLATYVCTYLQNIAHTLVLSIALDLVIQFYSGLNPDCYPGQWSTVVTRFQHCTLHLQIFWWAFFNLIQSCHDEICRCREPSLFCYYTFMYDHIDCKMQNFLIIVDILFIIRSRAFHFYANHIHIQTVHFAVPTGLFDLLKLPAMTNIHIW